MLLFTNVHLNIIPLFQIAAIDCWVIACKHKAKPAKHKTWKYGTLSTHLSEYRSSKMGLASIISIVKIGNVIYDFLK